MPTPWAMGQVKGRNWIRVHGHGGFPVIVNQLSISLFMQHRDRKLINGKNPYSLWHIVSMFHSDSIYFVCCLFKYKKILVENSFYLQAVCLGQNKASESQCCEPQTMVGFFGKLPGRLFLEEKHQRFSCGTLIGNRMAVQHRQESKMKWAGVFILVP